MARRSSIQAIAVPDSGFDAFQAGVAFKTAMAQERFFDAEVQGVQASGDTEHPAWTVSTLLRASDRALTDVVLAYSPFSGTFIYIFDDGKEES